MIVRAVFLANQEPHIKRHPTVACAIAASLCAILHVFRWRSYLAWDETNILSKAIDGVLHGQLGIYISVGHPEDRFA